MIIIRINDDDVEKHGSFIESLSFSCFFFQEGDLFIYCRSQRLYKLRISLIVIFDTIGRYDRWMIVCKSKFYRFSYFAMNMDTQQLCQFQFYYCIAQVYA